MQSKGMQPATSANKLRGVGQFPNEHLSGATSLGALGS